MSSEPEPKDDKPKDETPPQDEPPMTGCLIEAVQDPPKGSTPPKLNTLNDIVIDPRFVALEKRKIDMSGTDALAPHFRLLEYYRMPFDLNCLFFTIDGEGINEPDYVFMLIGILVTEQEKARYDIRTATHFGTNLYDKDGTLHKQRCYVWQRIVILKKPGVFASFCAETHNGTIPFHPPSPLQQVIDLHVSSHTPPPVRMREIEQLKRGYEIMLDLFDKLNKDTPYKYTPAEADKLAREIAEAARPFIARWVRQNKKGRGKSGKARRVRNIISFKAVAAAIGKSHNTLNAVNGSLALAKHKTLESMLKEIEKQEREAAQQERLKFLKGS